MGTGSISGTSAAYLTSSLTAGSHTITAVYPGDSNFNGVTSAGITQTVNKATPATGVFCNPSSLIYVPSGGSGNLTTCTATVNAPGSTANVVFTYNGNGWTTVPLSGGTASAAGFGHGTPAATYSINAAYAGDGNYNATSASTTFTVTKATPTTSVSCNPGSVVYVPSGGGALTTCTATVNAPGSTANVVFTYNGNGWTTVPLSGGSASAAGLNPGTPVATYSINAAYAGDGNYNPVNASTTFTVTKATPSIAVSGSGTPAAAGEPVIFTAASYAAGSSGTVTFLDGGNSIGSARSVAQPPHSQPPHSRPEAT